MIDKLLQLFRRAPVWDSPTCTVRRGSEGQMLTALVFPAPWRHPWNVQLAFRWLPNDKRPSWTATVWPGFVNESCPVVVTHVGNAPAKTIWREQMTKAQGVDLKNPEAAIDAPLFDLPEIALNWRNIGTDGDGSEAVPKFFQQLGVGHSPAPLAEASINAPINIDTLTVPKGNRLLRACDIVLIKPRAALTAQTEVSNPLVDSVTVTQSLGLKEAEPDGLIAG